MNLKILSKNYAILLLTSLLLLFSSCKWCSKEELQVLKATESGDVEALKTYLENDGEPQLCCWSREGRMGTQYDILRSVVASKSFEINEYYIKNYNISQEDKDWLLFAYLQDNNDTLSKLILSKNAKASSFPCINFDVDKKFDKLKEFNYNFNYQDPKTGNTLLIEYCLCPAQSDADELVKTLAYLIDLGAKTDIKNKDDKTAKDLAVNEKVKEFLENLDKD
jgi:hypothetical protein